MKENQNVCPCCGQHIKSKTQKYLLIPVELDSMSEILSGIYNKAMVGLPIIDLIQNCYMRYLNEGSLFADLIVSGKIVTMEKGGSR